MAKVFNQWNKEIDFDVAFSLMDFDIIEKLDNTITPCTQQEFFNAYAKAHEEKFGEEWELSKENPIY